MSSNKIEEWDSCFRMIFGRHPLETEPDSSVRLRLPAVTEGRTEACSLDIFEAKFIRCFPWVYPVCPNSSLLKASLVEVATQFPEMAGALVVSLAADGLERVFLDHTEPYVDFEESRDPLLKTADLALSSPSDYEAISAFLPRLCPTFVAAGFPFADGARMLKVRLTSLADGGGLLVLRVHHAAADASSVFRFVSEWARLARSKLDRQPVPLLRRQSPSDRHQAFLLRVDLSLPSPDPSQLRRLGWAIIEDPPFRLMPTARRLLRVTPEIASCLKAYALGGASGQRLASMVLSTNDVISALLLLLAARSQPKNEDEDVGLTIVMNARARLGEKGEGCFGNSVVHPTVAVSRTELLALPFSELCCRIREELSGWDRSRVAQSLTFAERRIREHPLERSYQLGCPQASVFVTNWTKFDLRADFGSGPPSHYIPSSPPVVGFTIAYPDLADPSVSCWILNLDPATSGLYDAMDLSNPSTYFFSP